MALTEIVLVFVPITRNTVALYRLTTGRATEWPGFESPKGQIFSLLHIARPVLGPTPAPSRMGTWGEAAGT
jgi:hypothetical protein